MTAPSRIPSSLDPARIVSAEAETNAGLAATPQGGALHQVNPDAYTQAGKTAAAKAIVSSRKSSAVQQSVGLSPLLDAATAFARTGYETRIISDANALELSKGLDASRSGFQVRLVHMLIERTVDHALIGTRPRARLSSSLNQAFGRTGERLDADRATGIDNLGLRRGEQGFTDTLIDQLGERRLNSVVVCNAIKEIKSADALNAAFESISKIFPSAAFAQSDRVKVLSAFLQVQGRLRASVVKITPGAGVMALQIATKERNLTSVERQSLTASLKAADVDALDEMRQQVNGIAQPPLFHKGDARLILAEAEQRLMLLRAL